MAQNRVIVFGAGFTGMALAKTLRARGDLVSATYRSRPATLPAGIDFVAFDEAEPALLAATHIISTVPPSDAGDPVLARYGDVIGGCGARWLGYYSTTGVYGDRGGGTVDETSVPAAQSPRAQRRVAAETAWRAVTGGRRALDIFRIAGIYGPGRSALDDVRAGQARRIDKPGHVFGRIHRDDIVRLTTAAMDTATTGTRILHLTDDEPSEPAGVSAFAAHLLGVPAPPLTPYDQAAPGMSEMARSFWAECRRVSNQKTKNMLHTSLLYPTYREGLTAIRAQEIAGDLA